MIRSILVPLDGSTFAESALPTALGLARKAQASLHLAQVLVPPAAFAPEAALAVDNDLYDRLLEQQTAAQQAYLDGVAQRLTAEGAPPVLPRILDGDTAGVLCRHAADINADLVVMSTHGRGAFARFWLGSVADELVRTSPVPLLLVRPEGTSADLARPPAVEHVLVPLDGSPLSEQIVGPAAELASLTGAELTLLRVVRPVMPIAGVPVPEGQTYSHTAEGLIARTTDLQESLLHDAGEYLAKTAAPLRARGLKVRTRLETEEMAATAILRANRRVDLIALATHGRGGLSRLFLGSVADKVIRGARVPVLVYRPQQSAGLSARP